jgi:ribosomal protein L34E
MIADMVPPWGTKVHYMSGIHTNVTTVQLPSGQARYGYLRDKITVAHCRRIGRAIRASFVGVV